MSDTAELTTVFDADNHYWEASDAFTRYRSPEFAERGVTVREVDGRMRYWVHDDLHPWIPGPGDVNPRPQPGAFLDRSGRSIAEMLTSEDPQQHPEWFHRDARLPVMDAAGRRSVLHVPLPGRVHGRRHAARRRGDPRHLPGLQPLASTTSGASPTRTGSSPRRT